MKREPRSMSTKEAAAIYERARRLANISLWAVDLQCRRLKSTEPEDTEFIFRKWADFDFLIVSQSEQIPNTMQFDTVVSVRTAVGD